MRKHPIHGKDVHFYLSIGLFKISYFPHSKEIISGRVQLRIRFGERGADNPGAGDSAEREVPADRLAEVG